MMAAPPPGFRYIDIHTHLLPGVDDGSPSVDGPSGRKTGSAASGVTVIFCSGIP